MQGRPSGRRGAAFRISCAAGLLLTGCSAPATVPVADGRTSDTAPAAATATAAAIDAGLDALLPNGKPAAIGTPLASDVLFSARFDRPQAAAVARDFGATRGVWSYVEPGPARLRLQQATGSKLGGTLNNNLPTPGHAGAARDLNGEPIIAPWMQSWGAVWNSCVQPSAMAALKSRIERWAGAGVVDLQFDDAGMQADSAHWNVGDLSAENRQAFARWVRSERQQGRIPPLSDDEAAGYDRYLVSRHGVLGTADYVARAAGFPSTTWWRRFLRETVQGCVAELREHFRATAGPQATLSINVYTPYPWLPGVFLVPYTDHVISEVNPGHAQWHQLYLFSHWLQAEGKPWGAVFPSADTDFLRSRIAMSYAVGALPVVPWDTFLPGEGGAAPTRHFGTAADLAYLYRFVRAHAVLFDGWQTLSRLNLLLSTDPAHIGRTLEQLGRLAQRQVPYLPVLQKPGQRHSLPPRRQTGLHQTWRAGESRESQVGNPRTLAQVGDAELDRLAVAHAPEADLQVLVKGHPARPGQRVVHVLRSGAPAGPPQAAVQLRLKAWALPSGVPRFQARVYPALAPGDASEPAPSTVRSLVREPDGDLLLDIPGGAAWVLLTLAPEASAP